jgi:hypothetical protein
MSFGTKILAASAAVLLAGACTGSRTADSAIIGAGVGAAAGAVVPGVSTAEGAIGGAVAGGVYGAVTDDGHSDKYCAKRYPRDSKDYNRCRKG